MATIFRFRVHRLCLILSLLFSTVGCDQVTKLVARDTLSSTRMEFLGGVIRLEHAENSGAFMNFGEHFSESLRFWIFTFGVAVCLSLSLGVLWKKTQLDKWNTIALTLVVAGGFGNLIDRAVKGSVTDFFNLGIGWFRTGIFNLADVAVMLGAAILLLKTIHGNRQNKTIS